MVQPAIWYLAGKCNKISLFGCPALENDEKVAQVTCEFSRLSYDFNFKRLTSFGRS